jgi:prevent-host-death family protein
MKHFTFSDMNRVSGEILETALIEPVALTKHGREKLVIMPATQYKRLLAKQKPQAFTLENAPDDIHRELIDGLNEIIDAPSSDV